MTSRKYGYFGPALPGPEGTIGDVFHGPTETFYRQRCYKGAPDCKTATMRSGRGPDVTLSRYPPAYDGEPFSDRHAAANHDYRAGEPRHGSGGVGATIGTAGTGFVTSAPPGSESCPILRPAPPQAKNGSASTYTNIVRPDPYVDSPLSFPQHQCDSGCVKDYYLAKMLNHREDRLRQHHPSEFSRPGRDPKSRYRYCMVGCPGGILQHEECNDLSVKLPGVYGCRQPFTPARDASGAPGQPFRGGASGNHDTGANGKDMYPRVNRNAWAPDPYNDEVCRPNFRGHSYKQPGYKAGRPRSDYFDPNPYRDCGYPGDHLLGSGTGRFRGTRAASAGAGRGRSLRGGADGSGFGDGLGDGLGRSGRAAGPQRPITSYAGGLDLHARRPFCSTVYGHLDPLTHVSPGPYRVQEQERVNYVHGYHEPRFVTANPLERPKATGRPNFHDFAP